MKIALVGNLIGTTFGMEVPDEKLIADELEKKGHEIIRIDHKDFEKLVVPTDGIDLIFLAKNKSHTNEKLKKLKEAFKAPLVFWMADHFDFAGKNQKQESWHMGMWDLCDLVLVRQKELLEPLDKHGVKHAYDCLDTAPDTYRPIYDSRAAWRNPQRRFPDPVPVGFVGNWIHEPSFRNHYVKVLADIFKKEFCLTTITMMEYKDRVGVDDSQIFHPMYGEDFSKLIGMTQINLSIENFTTQGFWSNRIARILRSGGFCMVVGALDLKQR
ncbi:MAG: hypothetical protein JRL30_28685, partial [Deltaproteobacteria bacterium]|nr:hypothetical protein [Deltaproteobacteria bacterium]